MITRIYLLLLIALLSTNCSNPCDSIDCGPNGTCITGECECDVGYQGTNCENLIIPSCSREIDSIGLTELYKSTLGDNWIFHKVDFYDYDARTDNPVPNFGNEWDFNLPISSWHGVELNENGCVTRLILRNCYLFGSLPQLNFGALEYFDCSRNFLTGNIPSINTTPTLRVFDCGENDLTGEIPLLTNLSDLRYFLCYGNELIGSMPDLDQVPSLFSFDCGRNNLTGSIPDLNNIPLIYNFLCNSNQLTGTIPDLSNLNDIGWFWCHHNDLEGCMPEHQVLCNARYRFYGNPKLPWQGDYKLFCDGESQIGAPCSNVPAGEIGIISSDCKCEL